MKSMPEAPKKRKYGCLRAFLIVLFLFAAMKGYSAYRNRPAGLYERWLGTPVPEDVMELEGHYTFRLTESVAWLKFQAPPTRIAQIVSDRNLTLVVPHPHWSVESDSRVCTMGKMRSEITWFNWSNTPPRDQEVYWISDSTSNHPFVSGWALYYSPSTQETRYVLHTY